MDIIYRINGGALTLLANQTSPTNISGSASDSVEVWLSEKQTATVLAASGSITYVGGKTATDNTGSAFTVSLTDLTGGSDSAPQEGDIVIVALEESGDRNTLANSDPTTAGYTTEVALNFKNTRDANLQVHWKFMTATPDTQIDFASAFSATHGRAVAIMVFRGVNATPFDVTTTTATGTGVLADPPSITPTTSGAVVIGVGGAGTRDGTPAVFTSSDFTVFLTAVQDDTFDAIIGMGYVAWTSGAVDPAAFGSATSGGNAEAYCAATLALRPA